MKGQSLNSLAVLIVLNVGTMLFLGNCSGGGGGTSSDAASSAITSSASSSSSGNINGSNAGSANRKEVFIPSSVMGTTGLELASTPAQSFSINLENCASGLTGPNTAAGTLKVYLDDTGCLAKLTTFTLHGQAYVPTGTGSVPFTDWLDNDTAVFVGASSTDKVYVTVDSQLSDPIQSTDTITYVYTVVKGSSPGTVSTTGHPVSLSVSGMNAPNFKINVNDAVLSDLVTGPTNAGYGLFTFKLTCTTGAMTAGANPARNTFCPDTVAGGTIAGGASGVDIGNPNNFSYTLVDDLNSNGTLTLAQLQFEFTGGDSTVNVTTDLVAGNLAFRTDELVGFGTVTTKTEMILALQAKDPAHPTDSTYSSFQYFPIHVTTFSP